MWSLIFMCLVIAVLSFQNVNTQGQDYVNYRSRWYSQRPARPVVIIGSRSGVVRTYEPPPPPTFIPVQDAKKVRLDVYYETDCPDSMRFITNQLYPLHQEMEDVLDIHLIPYGKAHETYNNNTDMYDFRCQHGPSECYGNMIQSCAMSLYPKEKDYINFINCMEKYPRPSMNGRKCARRLSLDWDKLDKCSRGAEGNRLLHEMAQKTENLNPRLYFVPWIVVDNVFSETNQRMAQRNLKSVVCNSYKAKHPNCYQ